MKKLNFFGWFVTAAALAFLASGCNVDESYDLANIDTEVTVLKGVELPLPNFKEVKLKDLVTMETGGVVKEVNGEYLISVEVDPQKIDGFTLDASGFTINAGSSVDKTVSLSSASIPKYTPLDAVSLTDAQKTAIQTAYPQLNIDLLSSLGNEAVDFSVDLDISISNFPTEIKAFKKADLGGTLNFSINPQGIPFGKFTIKQGTVITFPSFLRFSACDNANFTLSDGYKLTANTDVSVVVGTGLNFVLSLSGLDEGDGIATSGSLSLQDNITLSGVISISADDFTGPHAQQTFGTETIDVVTEDISLSGFKITASYATNGVSISSATIKADASAIPSLGSYGFDISGLPSFLTGDDVTIELTDVQMVLNLASTLPFQLTLANGKVNALKDGSTVNSLDIPSLDFAANATTGYSIGSHASGGTDANGNTYVNLSGLGSILNPVPSRIEASGFSVSIPEEWITVESGVAYGGTLNVGIYAPIAFSAASKVGFTIEAKNLSVDLGENITMDKAVLNLTAGNTIPLNFALSAKALDSNGNPVNNVTVTVDKTIAAGSGDLNSPTETPIKISLEFSGSATVKGLELKLDASSDNFVQGKALNPEQGIHLHNVSLSIPNGITTNLK